MVGWRNRLILVWKVACLALSAILFLGVATVSLADSPVKGRDAGGVASDDRGNPARAPGGSGGAQAKAAAAGPKVAPMRPAAEPGNKGGGKENRPRPSVAPAPSVPSSSKTQPAGGTQAGSAAASSPQRAAAADPARSDRAPALPPGPEQPRCPAVLADRPEFALLVEHWVDGKRQGVQCLLPNSDIAADVLAEGTDRVRGNEFWRSYITHTVPAGGPASSPLNPAGPQPTPPPSESQDVPPAGQPRSEQPGPAPSSPAPVIPTTNEVLGPEPPGAAPIYPVSQRPSAQENDSGGAPRQDGVRPDDKAGVEENHPAMPAASNGSQPEGSQEQAAGGPAQREAGEQAQQDTPQATPKPAAGRTAGWSQTVLALGAGIMLASWAAYFLWLRVAKRSPGIGGFWED